MDNILKEIEDIKDKELNFLSGEMKDIRENNSIWIIGVLWEENQSKGTEQVFKTIIKKPLLGRFLSGSVG